MPKIEKRILAETHLAVSLDENFLITHEVHGQAGHGLDWIDVVMARRIYGPDRLMSVVFEKECQTKSEASALYFVLVKSLKIGGLKSLSQFQKSVERTSELIKKEKKDEDEHSKPTARASRKPRWQFDH